jgi:DNA-binding LytR/AlgR family response regulator
VINIAICDDNLSTTELIENLILNNQKLFSEKIEISIFFSGESFSKSITKICPFDIVLMDIKMNGIDGIETSEKLRSKIENDSVDIIFISSHEEYHFQLFDVRPSGFIKKPIDEEIFNNKLINLINKTIKKKKQGINNFFPVHKKGKIFLIDFSSIIYFESRKRKIFIFTKEEEIKYYSTLNEEEKKLSGSNFVRIHQSYIVNFYFVKEISIKKIILTTQKELPISERRSVYVKQSYLNFRGELIE